MNRKTSCALIALALGMTANVQAQDYDDRWYFAPYLGYYHNDEDRLTRDGSLLVGGGIGRYISPNAAIDVFIDRTTRRFDEEACVGFGSCSHFNDAMVGASARWFFGDSGWTPYIMAGGGFVHSEGGVDDGWGGAVQVGGGLQTAYNDNVLFRSELGYRYNWDDESIPGEDNFGDIMLNLGLVVFLGEKAAPPPPPAPPAPAAPPPDCRTLDDDRDGVNNCDDKCPNSAAGEVVGPDGCAQEVVIDLRGVNFRFDCPSPHKADCRGGSVDDAGLLPGSVEILDQAVDVLKRYPNIRVEVAGHTDSTGPDNYNQGLSERRSTVVYEYLTGHGIDAGRLIGPVGYGEARPIDTNDTKEGRQRNRRTELAVQR
jgi:OOP family OmpA-OmpF porin